MRRLVVVIGILCLLIFCCELAEGQTRVEGWCERGGQTVTTQGLASSTQVQQSYGPCTITVVINGSGGTLATIYSDALLTPKANPFVASTDGHWYFYSNNQEVDVQASGSGIALPYNIFTDYKIANASAGVGGSGTMGNIAKFTASATVGNSIITESGQVITIPRSGITSGELDLGSGSTAFVVQIKAPTNLAGNLGITLPTADAVGCVQSNGAGIWSISSCSSGGLGDPGGNGIVVRTALNTTVARTLTGTLSRLAVTNGTGVSANPTFDIDAAYVGQASITTLGTIGTGTWQGSVIGGTYGGSGVNNGANTITLGGNISTAGLFTTSGAFALTLTQTAATNVTLPTTGTLATLIGTETFNNKTLNSPTLITPTLGAATATTINKYTFTQPTNGATLTILDGKTLTINNTITLVGADSQTYTFPNVSDTVAALGTVETFTATQTILKTALGITVTDALILYITTAAINTQGQVSPSLHLQGAIFDNSPSTPLSKTIESRIFQSGIGGNSVGYGTLAITSITNATPSLVTTALNHGFTTGMQVTIVNTTGAGSATINATWFIQVLAANTFYLIGSASPGAINAGTGNVSRAAQSFMGLASSLGGAPTTLNAGVWNTNIGNGGIFIGQQTPGSFVANLQLTGSYFQTDSAGGIPTTLLGQGVVGGATIGIYSSSHLLVNAIAPGAVAGGGPTGHWGNVIEFNGNGVPTAGTTYVAQYVAIQNNSSNSSAWAMNPLVIVAAGVAATTTHHIIEGDLNWGPAANAQAPAHNGAATYGFRAVSGGAAGQPSAAFAIDTAISAGASWQYGLWADFIGNNLTNSTFLKAGTNVKVDYGLDFQDSSGNTNIYNKAAIRITNNAPIVARDSGNLNDIKLLRYSNTTPNALEVLPSTNGMAAVLSFGAFTSSLGITQPGVPVLVEQAADGAVNLVSFGAIGSQTNLRFIRANGVSGALTALTANQQIANFQASGHDGGAITTSRAAIQFFTVNAWSAGVDNSTAIIFATTSPASATQIEKMRVNATGILSTNFGAAVVSAATITPSGANFHVTGAVGITAIATSNGGETFTTGSVINIVFDAAPTLTNGASLVLKGGVNATPAAASTMSFLLDGTIWRETARSF